jgi:hypothetical protein
MTCKHAKRNCSHLPFAEMQVITTRGIVAIVKCTEHAPKDSKGTK